MADRCCYVLCDRTALVAASVMADDGDWRTGHFCLEHALIFVHDEPVADLCYLSVIPAEAYLGA